MSGGEREGGGKGGGKEGRNPVNCTGTGVDLSSGGTESISTCHSAEIASTPFVEPYRQPAHDDGGRESVSIVIFALTTPSDWPPGSYQCSSLAFHQHIASQRNRRSAHRQDAGQSQGVSPPPAD